MSADERAGKIPVTAAVLAGGRSLRMGVDKTLLTVEGESLLERVTHTVSRVCAETIVVTNRPEALEDESLAQGVRVVTDEVPYQGPLGGLSTALANAGQEWVFAIAADLPALEPAVVETLWNLRDSADVVVPVGEKGYEPLLALYRVEACLPVAREVLASGRRRLVAMFGSLNVVEVPVDSLSDVDPGLKSLVNVNTPEDLAAARSKDGVHSPSQRNDTPPQVIEAGSRRSRGMPQERPITLYMNDVEVATVQATPRDLEEMGTGFLLAEGLIRDRDAFQGVDVDAKRGMVWLRTAEAVPDDMVYKTRYVTSGCGKGITFSSVGHARNLDPVTSELQVDSQTLYDMVGQMARASELYRDTGGTHSCGLGKDGQILVVKEDVGRHNAVDKLLGRAWLDRIPTDDAVLLTTGRISYEMAVKAAKSRIPLVVSRTAVTDLAADIAATLGITLVGYARGGKLVVYTHPERVMVVDDVPRS